MTDSGGVIIQVAMLLGFLSVYISASRKQLDFHMPEHAIFFGLSMVLFLFASPLLVR